MFKKIIVIIILTIICGLAYRYLFPYFLNNNEIVYIEGDKEPYKFKPKDTEGKSFNGDSLRIYDITRERLLPDQDIKILDKASDNLSKIDNENQITEGENTILTNSIYLQLGSFKTLEKAKSFINTFKEKKFQITNNLKLNIISADIPERGTYYRVRLGPFNNNKEIFELCLDLKLVNNECLIVKDK